VRIFRSLELLSLIIIIIERRKRNEY